MWSQRGFYQRPITRALINRKNEYKDTLIRRGASLGANSTIVCGVTVGEFAFIGAGAVINRCA